jgi:hypothetical protein
MSLQSTQDESVMRIPRMQEENQGALKVPSPVERFFENGLRAIFTHISQMFSASLVVAAGTYATKRVDALQLRGVINLEVAGYILVAVGIILLILNFLQGLYQVTKLRHSWVFQGLLVMLYIFVSLRAAQLAVAFRNGF